MGALADDLENLRARVALMRELGVREWGDIKLGPDVRVPNEAMEPVDEEAKPGSEHPLLYAAAGG